MELTQEEALLRIEENLLPRLTNEQVVDAIVAWYNNEFTEEATKNKLLVNTKEGNTEHLLSLLNERYDKYVVVQLNMQPLVDYRSQLDMNSEEILFDTIQHFNFKNGQCDRAITRLQIEEINTQLELQSSIFNYIEEQLLQLDYLEQKELDRQKNLIFIALMVQLLFYTSDPLSWDDVKALGK